MRLSVTVGTLDRSAPQLFVNPEPLDQAGLRPKEIVESVS